MASLPMFCWRKRSWWGQRGGGNGSYRAVWVIGQGVVDAFPVFVDRFLLVTSLDGSDLRFRLRRPLHDVIAVVGRQIYDA